MAIEQLIEGRDVAGVDRFDSGAKVRVADDGPIEKFLNLLAVGRHALACIVERRLAAPVGLPAERAVADEQLDQRDRSLARSLMQWGRLVFAGLARRGASR